MEVRDGASVALLRDRVREHAARIELPMVLAAALVNVASELAHNQLSHAVRGFVEVREARRGVDRGIEVIAADAGRGIADPARALEGRGWGSSATSLQADAPVGSLGVGLAAVLELADEVDIDVRLGEGTCVWARKFARTDTRRRRVGVYGRPCEGERESGDDATFVRTAAGLVAGVVDGLGHGEAARKAAERARDVVLAEPELDPATLLRRCDAALAHTRGAVMTVVRIDEAREEIALACVGNVAAQLVGPAGSRRFGGSSFVLGSPGGARRVTTEVRPIEMRDALVLFSDGVSSRMDLTGEHDLLREHPVVVAQRVVERFAREHDDVTVLVVA
jgi:anti-sigma regulatory factor (Ser/Thr protein kinase)/serine/threonine protein phosphatase PrpC